MFKMFVSLLLIQSCFFTASIAANGQHDANKTLIVKRPQEPKQPYPYLTEEVSFQNKKDGVTLSGTLSLPSSRGPFPAVILLHGSGPIDRDETLHGHKHFLVWADYLTRHGIAVLRYDKRSVGKSGGNYDTATIQDFAEDALAGVEYLKSRKEINTQQIGLIGHSEGGMTAPLVATKSKDIAFLVIMAAPCVKWQEIVDSQIVSLQRIDGVSESTINLSQRIIKQIFALLQKYKDQRVAEKILRDLISKNSKILEPYYGPLESQVKLCNSTWFRYYINYDPAAILRQVRVPVLALNGDLDPVVLAKQNLMAITSALDKAKNKDYTVKQLPRLNHCFQNCKTGSMKECFEIEETASPVVLQMMTEWILEKSLNKKM